MNGTNDISKGFRSTDCSGRLVIYDDLGMAYYVTTGEDGKETYTRFYPPNQIRIDANMRMVLQVLLTADMADMDESGEIQDQWIEWNVKRAHEVAVKIEDVWKEIVK